MSIKTKLIGGAERAGPHREHDCVRRTCGQCSGRFGSVPARTCWLSVPPRAARSTRPLGRTTASPTSTTSTAPSVPRVSTRTRWTGRTSVPAAFPVNGQGVPNADKPVGTGPTAPTPSPSGARSSTRVSSTATPRHLGHHRVGPERCVEHDVRELNNSGKNVAITAQVTVDGFADPDNNPGHPERRRGPSTASSPRVRRSVLTSPARRSSTRRSRTRPRRRRPRTPATSSTSPEHSAARRHAEQRQHPAVQQRLGWRTRASCWVSRLRVSRSRRALPDPSRSCTRDRMHDARRKDPPPQGAGPFVLRRCRAMPPRGPSAIRGRRLGSASRRW